MSRHVVGSLTLALGVALVLAQPLVGPLSASQTPSQARPTTAAPTTSRATVASDYGRLPLAFEVNAGQADGAIRFLAHGSGYTLALTPSQALLALAKPAPAAPSAAPDRFTLRSAALPTSQPTTPATVLGMAWLGANPHPVVTGERVLPGTVTYFIGNDPAKWHTNIATYQQVRLHDVYPGVDLVYYGTGGQLEFDFVVAPGANPDAVRLGFTGQQQLGVDLQGNLSLVLPGGTIAQRKPLVYQTEANGARQTIAGGYTLTSSGRVGFVLGAYNPRLPLVIDPAYQFSTYLGGNTNESGNAIAVDASGNAYVAGSTSSTNFPTTAGAFQTGLAGTKNAFVSKLNAAGTALVYSTYLGGNTSDSALAIALDASGDATVTGYTDSTNFPTTLGAFQANMPNLNGGNVAYVSRLNPTGTSLVYSTYLGGNNGDFGVGIAVDSGSDAYVVGFTSSNLFPTTFGAFQTTYATGGDAFVTKLNPTGTALVYSTFLGGSNSDFGYGIALDASGDAYVSGQTSSTDFPTTPGALQTSIAGGTDDAFVTKLNPTGTALVYSTFLGGSGADIGNGIAVDASGDAYITGATSSTNFPTTTGAFQTTLATSGGNAFVTKLNPTGTALSYSTYLGGSGVNGDMGKAIAVDTSGDAYVTGVTISSDFPLVNPLQNTLLSSTNGNAFVSRLNASGAALIFSTYLGGSGTGGDSGQALALSTGGIVYIAGYTTSTNFPTTNALYPTFAGGADDAFVTKLQTFPSVDTTTGVFRPTNGVLYLKNANTTGPADIALAYGQPGDQPITGDWTGKGYKSIGIYRGGTFYLRNSNTTGFADITVPFGKVGDIPVAGDWTGKGYDSIGIYRPSNSTFYLRDSNTNGLPDHTATLGISGDVPIVGDWTGKGYDSIGVFRPSNGIVYLRNSNTTGVADIHLIYGIAGDKPVVGDWTGQGFDTIGVDRNGQFLLRNFNTTGPANISFYLGVSGDDPIAGPWLAPASVPPPHRGAPSHGAASPSHAAIMPSKGRVAPR